MDRIENKLKTILFRSYCPSKMDLGEFELGLLSPQRENEIGAHLVSCPHCQADIVQMRQFMALPAIGIEKAAVVTEQKSPMLERIKVIVVDLLSPPAGMQSPAALQPVFRGAESETTTRVIEADAYIVAITASSDKISKSKHAIIGDITPLFDDDETFQDWTAGLWRSGQLLASTEVGADSHFSFKQLQLDNPPHELILSGPTVEIHLQNLHIA